MAGILDYITYGPQNPVLSRVSQLGERTGVQNASKKMLTVASQAGAPFRKALGYGEKYNITQAQAGEIGYVAGSIVGGYGAAKAGPSLAGGLSRMLGSESGTVFITGSKAAPEVIEVASNTKKGISMWNVAKYGLGAGAIAGTAYVGAVGFKTAADIISSWGPNPPMPPYYPPGNGGGGTDGTKKGGGTNGGGGGGGTDGGTWPPGFQYTYPSDWLGYVGQGLGALPGSIGQGLGGGIEEVGAGIGGSVIPLAIIGGVIYYATKKKSGGKKRK